MLLFSPFFFRLYCCPPAQFLVFPPALEVLLSLPFSKSFRTLLFFPLNPMLSWIYSFHNFVICILYHVSVAFLFLLSLQHLYHISRWSQRLSSLLISRLPLVQGERLGWLFEGDRSPQNGPHVTCPRQEGVWTVWPRWLSLYGGYNLANFKKYLVFSTSNSW